MISELMMISHCVGLSQRMGISWKQLSAASLAYATIWLVAYKLWTTHKRLAREKTREKTREPCWCVGCRAEREMKSPSPKRRPRSGTPPGVRARLSRIPRARARDLRSEM